MALIRLSVLQAPFTSDIDFTKREDCRTLGLYDFRTKRLRIERSDQPLGLPPLIRLSHYKRLVKRQGVQAAFPDSYTPCASYDPPGRSPAAIIHHSFFIIHCVAPPYCSPRNAVLSPPKKRGERTASPRQE